ncbi:glycosyltransferase [Clostridium perfringens]|nr:glycosyltransferase [Clostridium perfringens]
MVKNNKVLFISHVDSLGGAEKVLLSAIKEVDKQNECFIILNNRGNGRLSKVIDNKYITQKYTFGLLNTSILRSVLEFPFTLITLIRLIKFVKKYNIDTIYSNTGVNILGILLARLTQNKHIWHIHEQFGGVFNKRFSFLHKKLMKYDKNFNIYISNKIKDNWEENIGAFNSKVIRNPINMKLEKNRRKIEYEKIKLGFAGSIVKNKNLILILNVLKELQATNDNFYLSIAGDGELKKEMEIFCEENNLKNNVEFCGNVENMNSFYEKIDILILPSFTEGVPLVVLEAAAKQKLIIMTKKSGIDEILQDGIDYISINPHEIKSLYDALLKILKNNGLGEEISENAFLKIKEYLKNNNFGEEIRKVLK